MKKEQEEKRTLAETKTRIPEPERNLLSRRRLCGLLEESQEDIIVFQAGAGFGKTAAMAEWARKNEARTVWYRMSGTDNHPQAFAAGIAQAIARKLPVKQPETEPEEWERETNNLSTYEKPLVKTLSAMPKGFFYVFLDQFEKISNEKIYHLLRDMLYFGEGRLRLVLGLRGALPGFLGSYLMQGKVCVICTKELRFEKMETELLLSDMAGKKLGVQTVARIHAYMKGWPAGIVFAGLALKAGTSGGSGAYLYHKTQFYQYINHEIFRVLPCEILQFLLDISVLEEINVPICNFVRGRGDSGRILLRLLEEDLFLSENGADSGEYSLNPVFLEFFQEQIPVERKKEISLKEAKYYILLGKWEQGARAAMKCQERGTALLAAAVVKRTDPMLLEGKDELLGRWISALIQYSKTMPAEVLYSFFKYYRFRQQEREAKEILYLAAKKAYVEAHFDQYAQYMLALIKYTAVTDGIALAEELSAETIEMLSGHLIKEYAGIVLCHMEFQIQMEDYEHLELFLRVSSNPERNRPRRLDAIRDLVQWAILLWKKPGAAGTVLAEARLAAVQSKVFAEYGFYRVVYQMYRNGETGWEKLAEEGICFGGQSVFYYWMKLLLALAKYRRDTSQEAEAARELLQIEEYRIKMGLYYPEWRIEDAELLQEILAAPVLEAGADGLPEAGEKKAGRLWVKCLGPFLVEGKNGPIRWRTRKVKELFACLFYEEGRGIKKDILIDRLWPETDRRKANTLFHTTMSYLRKGLAAQEGVEVLNVRNQSYALDMTKIDSDMKQLMEWRAYADRDEIPEGKNVLEAADLYHQCYMYGEDYLWLEAYPDYIEQIYLQTLDKLAEGQYRRKEYKVAVLLLGKALELDCYAGHTFERMIECLALSGDIQNARKQFEKMKKLYREELGEEVKVNFETFLKKKPE